MNDLSSFVSGIIEFVTPQGEYREEYRVFRRQYECICNFWVNDDSVMNDKVITDIMGFIISKNILHSSFKADDREVAFRIEIIIKDENREQVAFSDLSERLCNEILYKTVSSVGEKRFMISDFYTEKKYFLDGVDFESQEEICECLDDEKASELCKCIALKKEILQRYSAES